MRLGNFLVYVLVCCLAACAGQPAAADAVTLIHLNDTYRVDAVEEGNRGGFGRVATIVRDLRAGGADVRLLHGGDFLHPSLESQLWDGEQMVEAMNYLDGLAEMVVVPGNHEFDEDDAQALVARIKESRFDWLGDNLRLETGDAQADAMLRRAYTFTAGTRRIGIFALTMSPEESGDTRAYAAIDGDYVAAAERAISRLESAGVDAIVGLTHLNLGDDIEVAKLKARHPQFLLIAGGHEHEPEFRPGDAGNATVLKGASNARTIWRIDLQFAGDGIEVTPARIAVDESIAPDPQYQPIADRWRGRLEERMPFLTARLGTATLPMDARESIIRSRETAWGDFIADQMRGAFGREPADLAFVNSGTLRIDDFIAEDITWEDIARTFGYPSQLRRLNMTGAEFRRLLEAGYRGKGGGKGYFPQVSGFRVCVDRGLPDFSRIVSLQVPADGGWREIDGDAVYAVVMPDYLFNGGDGYRVPETRKQAASPAGSELKYLVFDAILDATADGRTVGAAVSADDPRYVERGPARDRCFP